MKLFPGARYIKAGEHYRTLTVGERVAFTRGAPLDFEVVYVEGVGYSALVEA